MYSASLQMSMIELTYLGHANSSPLEESKILDFARSARAWNSEYGLTGAILYGNHFFIQVIEGKFNGIEKVCGKINRYSPCENIIRLDSRPLKLRSFASFPALCVSTSQLEKKLPLLANALKNVGHDQKEQLLYITRQFSDYHFEIGPRQNASCD